MGGGRGSVGFFWVGLFFCLGEIHLFLSSFPSSSSCFGACVAIGGWMYWNVLLPQERPSVTRFFFLAELSSVLSFLFSIPDLSPCMTLDT
jgi:hypothetical protein